MYGRVNLELAKLRPDLQREWMTILERPVEGIVRDAEKQIRATKQGLSMSEAKGLLIVANAGNLLYTSPSDYMAVVARVLNKKMNGARRFQSVKSVLYIFKGNGSLETSRPSLTRSYTAFKKRC